MATAAAGGDRLGEILLREGLVTREQLGQALTEQKNTKHRLGYVLVKLGLVQELEITKVLARQYRMPAVDLTRFEVDPKIIKLVPAEMATKTVLMKLASAQFHPESAPGPSDASSLFDHFIKGFLQ